MNSQQEIFNSSFIDELSKIAEKGEGMGVGGPRQMMGGVSTCKCPKCEYEAPHKRGVPCTGKKCPKCGTMMIGK